MQARRSVRLAAHGYMLTSLAALAAGLSGTGAQAQVAASPEATVANDRSAEESPVVDQEGATLGDIVVTATRRAENIQNVPISVSAIGAETLATAGVENIRQVAVLVPGYVGSRNFGGLQPTIRGVGSTGISVGDETNVAVYVDGVYIPSHYANTSDLVELDRVEVLRGPQGTLFGRNATGGLINLITPDPSFETRGRVVLGFGRMKGASAYQAKGYVTGALSSTIAADAAFSYRRNDPYIRNLGAGGKLGEATVTNYRGKLLWQPSASAKIILTGQYSDFDDNTPNSAHIVSGNRPASASVPGNVFTVEPFTAALSFAPFIRIKSALVSLRTSFDLGFASLETTGAWFRMKGRQRSDSDFTAANVTSNIVKPTETALSQEVRLVSSASGPFKWIAGIYGFHSIGEGEINLFSGAAPTFAASSVVQTTLLRPRSEVNALAGFAEGTYALTDALEVTAGARYSTEKRTFRTSNFGVALFPEAEKTSSRWTYRGSIKYTFAPKANVYATYSTGFKSGVFNTFGTNPAPTNPETIKSIEVGLKADPARWLRTNVSLFHYDYDDLQVTARDPVVPSLYRLLNAARVKIKGGELEVEAAATDELTLRFAGSLLDGKYDDFPLAQIFTPNPAGGNVVSSGNVAGRRLTKAPEYTVSFTGTWAKEVGIGKLSLSGTAFHSARVYYDFANFFSQRPYTLVNADISLALPGDRWRLGLSGTNLTNAKVAQQIGPISAVAAYQNDEAPLRVLGTVEYRF